MEDHDLIPKSSEDSIKVYKRRWVILLIYILYTAGNSFQWIEYSIITNTMTKYYGVSPLMVNWTSILYMATYPLAVVPVSYLITIKGLRVAALCGGIGTGLAALIKAFAIPRDSFHLVLLGQVCGSIAQIFILALPTKLAAVWFKPSEMSMACALGVFGNQLGFAIGFIVPPTLVKSEDDLDSITQNMKILSWGLVFYMIPLVLCITFFFPKKPPLPPSIVQLEAKEQPRITFSQFIDEFLSMLRNRGLICHVLGYGFNYGIFTVVGTLLNQYILQHFPHGDEDAGRMGFVSIICGLIGAVLCGFVLDKTHKFKETCLYLIYVIFLSMALFIMALWQTNLTLTYLTLALFMFFNNSYITAGFEFAIEITFPQEESTVIGILNAVSQTCGVFLLLAAAKINEKFGSLWSLTGQLIFVSIGAILTYAVPNLKNRQNALTRKNEKVEDSVIVKLSR